MGRMARASYPAWLSLWPETTKGIGKLKADLDRAGRERLSATVSHLHA